MTQDYAHQDLNTEFTAIGGYYILIKEVRLPFHEREILYLVGHAVFDTTCCGIGGCAYALVPGFISSWRTSTNSEGLSVSQVEPIRDKAVQERVRQLIEQQEMVHQVTFQ